MAFIYNLTDSWTDAATTWNGIKLAVTDTASSASSKLLDLSISGASTGSFTVDKSGNLVLSGSVNKVTLTAPATSATLTLADGSSFITSGAYSSTFTFTGATTLTFPTSGTVTALGNSTTGSGSIVLASSPTLVSPDLGTPSSVTLTNATGLPVSTGLTGTGTGVVTALGVNVGTAGAFVTNGGALGTPSSGTLTNATGLPVGGISATGTPSSTTYLRGDGSWAALSGAGTVTSVGQTFTGGLISVSGSPVTSSGTLALTVAGTSGGVPYFSSASTWASTGVLTSGALLIGGGAGLGPSATTTGTGVVTALGTNVGSAGAFVVNGGALGTPSSGTLTNATGLPISTGVSGLGTGVATFLATPSSANLRSAVTDETGTGSLVFATTPTLVTPILGTPTSGTLTNCTGLPVGGISATGTPSASTYLRGDGSWATVTGSGTVNSGTINQLGYYAATGTAISGNANATISSGALTLGVAGSAAGSVLLSGSTSGAVTVRSAATAGTWSLTLPTTAGTNGYVLSTDGTGVTSWIASSGGGGTVTSVAQTFTGGLISVSGSPITGSGTLALTVAGTSGGIPYFSSASTWATSAALAANALMVGGGAGVAPSTVTTGTGVVTALGVNVGTAGAFVTNGGALGTPSSGTLTNATGLPVGGISATGTPSSTTYLRGDGSWSTVSSSLVVGTSVVTGGGAVGDVLFINTGGVLGSLTSTGTGNNVRADNPVLTSPSLGTPSNINLSNATNLPVTTGISGLGTGVATFLATPTSANLAAAVTNETGSGSLVFSTAPTFGTNITVGAAASSTGIVNLKGTTSGTVSLSVADAAGTWTMKLPTTAGTNGYVLSTDGTGVTSWIASSGGGGTVTSVAQTFTGGLISVSGSPITGSGTLALTVAGTSGGIPYFSSASTWATSAALAADALMVGGGAGVAPSTVTTGTGVVTALGVNVGTAGAVVVNGGALGTPSSGTLTNATGLPVGGISATGTPSASTYLRGDGTWSTVSGAGTVTSVAQTFTGGLISVSGSPITGSGTLDLTVAGTSGGIPYFSSASTWATSAALAANALMVGGGAGVAPSTVTTGTGVVTALGVNVGTAGAVVVNGGALGTPSSGTLTNATGLPISTGVSGLGTGVATFLATPSSANLASAVTDETGSGSLVFSTAPTFDTNITVGTAASSTGVINLKGTTSGTVGLSVADAAGTWTMKLPTTAGTNGYVLSTDGTGVTSWTAVASGGLTVGTTSISGGTSGNILYNNAGSLGELATTGSGSVARATSPTITTGTYTGLRETKTTPTISSFTLTLDCSVGNVFALTLNSAINTITFTNVPASGTAYSLTLAFTANGTSYTVAWGSSVKWPNGTAPTLTTTNTKVDTFVLTTYDGGTTWYAFVAGQNS